MSQDGFTARAQGAAGAGQAVAGVNISFERPGICVKVVIRVVVQVDRLAGGAATFYQAQVAGLGLAIRMQLMAV